MQIKDLPTKERPRERLILSGAKNISDIELISIILRTGTKNNNVKEVATNLLKSVVTLKHLESINKEQLLKIKGIGQSKAITLLAAIELGRRIYTINEVQKKTKLNNSKIIYETNKHLFINQDQECFYCLYLNNKKELIERKLLFMGTINRSIVHPREIFKEAYLLSASSIICMHNHPSGDIIPSQNDIILTKALIDIGKLQQIPLVDHIIFGQDEYYSFYDHSDFMR